MIAHERGTPGAAWDALALSVPLVNAPMGGAAGGRLASAVTAAGGLGMIGMGSYGTAEALADELDHMDAGGGPFGIGLVDWVVRRNRHLLDVAIDAHPALLSVSFGAQWEWVDAAHAAGILTATQIYNPDEARRAQDAGVDVVVARGAEGGGHGAPELGMLPLLDAVLGAVSVPVLAAGGIASPRSVAGVLAAGASGVWVGTALAACTESLTSEWTRAAMITARSIDTVVTSAYDAALGLAWPARFPARVLRTERSRHGDQRGADTRSCTNVAACRVGSTTSVPVDAGQGVGLVTAVESVSEVVARLFPCRLG